MFICVINFQAIVKNLLSLFHEKSPFQDTCKLQQGCSTQILHEGSQKP